MIGSGFCHRPSARWASLRLVPLALMLLMAAGYSAGIPRAACGQDAPSDVSSDAPTELTAEILDEASHLAAQYIVRRTQASGQFVYAMNLDPDVPVKPEYNMVRHAGAMYALGDYQARFPHPRNLQALKVAAEFLMGQVGPVADQPGLLTLWSDPEVELDGSKYSKAQLGGAGLGLTALCLLPPEVDSPEIEAARQGMARFQLYMQQPDGQLLSLYVHGHGVRRDWDSLYYPGEACLGWIELYHRTGDPQWYHAAVRSLDYLARLRHGQPDPPHDHWALIATGRLQRVAAPATEPISAEVRERILAHGVQLCEAILASQTITSTRPAVIGSFDQRGQSTPAATRLEGLVAALDFLDKDQHAELRARIERALELGCQFLLRAQRTTRDRAPGAVPWAVGPLPENDPLFTPRFNRRATEVRIDYPQHFLSAIMHYREHRFGRPPLPVSDEAADNAAAPTSSVPSGVQTEDN